jgi:hypothetical protein
VKRVLLIGALVVVVGAVFGGGFLLGTATDDDTEKDAAGITEAEHDRLLDACMASTSKPAACPGWVSGIVDAANERGCGYGEAADLIAWYFDRFEQPNREQRIDAVDRILDCPEGESTGESDG